LLKALELDFWPSSAIKSLPAGKRATFSVAEGEGMIVHSRTAENDRNQYHDHGRSSITAMLV